MDPSIAVFEKDLIRGHVITTSFDNIVRGTHDASRKVGWIFIIALLVSFLIRSSSVIIMTKVKGDAERILGDYLQILGINGTVLHM